MSAAYMREPFQRHPGDVWKARQMPVVYLLDAADRLYYVNRTWDWFAANNHGEHLHTEAILGRSLWDLMTEPDACAWYGTLFAHVRAGNPVVLNIRCDSADWRRLLQLQMFAEDQGFVSCVSGVVEVMRRPYVRLLDRTLPRASGTVRLCSWCGRIEARLGSWREIEDAIAQLGTMSADPLPQIEYTTCPECARYVGVLTAAF